MKTINNYENTIMGDTEMDFFKYKEDTSLEARKLEISVKRQRINRMLDERGMEALLLAKHLRCLQYYRGAAAQNGRIAAGAGI